LLQVCNGNERHWRACCIFGQWPKIKTTCVADGRYGSTLSMGETVSPHSTAREKRKLYVRLSKCS
jgi:hypothetical protein